MIKNISINNGWVESALKIESPNYNTRPKHEDIYLLVVHCIALPPKQYEGSDIIDFFCNRLDCTKNSYYQQIENLKVSAHFLIRRNGALIQFVSTDQRAWHAGESSYQGRDNCNDYSIGIELEGSDDSVYEIAQYKQLANLTQVLQKHYPKIQDNITGHENIAPGRKTDPGLHFDWDYYLYLLS